MNDKYRRKSLTCKLANREIRNKKSCFPDFFIKKALEKGLVIISAGANIIRFVPPLVIEREHVDEMLAILCDVLDTIE